MPTVYAFTLYPLHSVSLLFSIASGLRRVKGKVLEVEKQFSALLLLP